MVVVKQFLRLLQTPTFVADFPEPTQRVDSNRSETSPAESRIVPWLLFQLIPAERLSPISDFQQCWPPPLEGICGTEQGVVDSRLHIHRVDG